MKRQISIKACAKINLGLDVIGLREDGYHQVKMILQSLMLHDELTFQEADEGIVLTTDSGELPTDKENLIYKAAALLMESRGVRRGVRIHLAKRIPVAAGMAGGSSDAAAAMKGICELFHLKIPLKELMDAAVSIGADVPYCLMGGAALAEGIGERLTALPPLPDCHILVAKPEVSVSTKSVYQRLDAIELTKHPDIDGMAAALRAGDLRGITSRLENVLEAVTIPAHPVVDALKDRMKQLGAAGSLMSGSGPAVFGIFPAGQKKEAESAFHQLAREEPSAQVFLTSPAPAPLYPANLNETFGG